tara:strand:- start:2366 stop:2845 length:480 start_codon:yes stop_codon:yes gene_type:complete
MNNKLYVDKLKAEVKFLKLESQYIRSLFESALLEFNNQFKENLENKKTQQNQKPKKSKSKNLDKIYKKIANKVHPDKPLGSKATFNELTNLVEQNDLSGLMNMAETYNIDVMKDINIKTYEVVVDDLKDTIDEYKSTIAYQWKYSNQATKNKIESIIKK